MSTPPIPQTITVTIPAWLALAGPAAIATLQKQLNVTLGKLGLGATATVEVPGYLNVELTHLPDVR